MAEYKFKNGKLPKALLKKEAEKDALIEALFDDEDEKEEPQEEVSNDEGKLPEEQLFNEELSDTQPVSEEQAAFFTGEDATKIIKTADAEAEKEPQAAFYTGEDATRTMSAPVALEEEEEEEEPFNPFDDDDEVSSSKNKLRTFLGSGKKSKQISDDVLSEVGEIYSASNVKDVEETMKSDSRITLSEIFGSDKKKKKSKKEDSDGENDEYEIESAPIEDVYEANDDDEDNTDYEDEYTKNKKRKKDEMREYLSPDEKEEFYENYRRKSRRSLLSVLAALIFTLLLFYLESPSFDRPDILNPGKYGILYLLADLQLLFLSGVCILDRLTKGASALFKWAPTKNSVSFLLFVVSALQILLHLIFDRDSDRLVLFSSIAALCALINAIVHFLDVRREGIAFRMAASSTPKYIASSLSEESDEHEIFEKYLPESPSMFSLSKTGFVSNFVSTSKAPSAFDEVYKIILPLVLFTSVMFAVIANIMAGSPTFGKAIDNFTLAFMLSTPIASFFTVSLPFFKGTLKMAKRGCAVIGEASLYECSTASVISFKDTDVFHAKGIKVTSVKTYGEARIDTAIFTAARVFNITGGPLKEVFNRSIIDPGSSGAAETDTVLQVSPSSVLSIIDGQKIVLGTSVAMESIGLECPDDPVDDMFKTSGGRIMYMSVEGALAAKFYIKYSIGKNFKAILDTFYDIGVCMSIKSSDPNLDTDFLTALLKDKNYPIVVIKLDTSDTATLETEIEKAPTGILSNTSVPNLLRSFIWCDKCRRIITLNNLAKYIGIIISIVILVVCLLNSSSHEKITPAIICLYQLIWTLPVFGTSIFQ